MTKNIHKALINNAKDYIMIIFGLLLYGVGFTAFILPHEIVIGGLSGVGTLVYFGTRGFVSVAVPSMSAICCCSAWPLSW